MRPLPCCAGEPGGTGVGRGEGGPGLTPAFLRPGATKDMGKMLGGDEEKDPDAAKREEERQEALRQEEAERKAKCARMEAEREAMRQGIRDKVGARTRTAPAPRGPGAARRGPPAAPPSLRL
ncbi:hypothetical protein J1605_009233 [Eschrichtius robustus]|uniref:Complexin-1 n=1 Tax=Eschrichtius robustus TaxID=9764 RepID=A0AB34GTU8_ESCRO|nr:hypothetical protein J1605_009233 [Eschrichtius robustus]